MQVGAGIKRFAALAGWFSLSSVLGVVVATSFTCGVGLIEGTSTWCGSGLFWLVGWPFAVSAALVIGVPAYFPCSLLGSSILVVVCAWWTAHRHSPLVFVVPAV